MLISKFHPKYEITIDIALETGYRHENLKPRRIIFTRDENAVTYDEAKKTIYIQMTDNLISFTTKKDLSEPVGTFTLELSAKPVKLGNGKTDLWSEILQPTDFVSITAIYDKDKRKPIFWGTISEISDRVSYDEKPNASITIIGRCITSYFIDQKIAMDSFLMAISREGTAEARTKLMAENQKIFSQIVTQEMTKEQLFNRLFESVFESITKSYSIKDSTNSEFAYQIKNLEYSNGKKFKIASSDSDKENIFRVHFCDQELGAYPATINVLIENNNFWAILTKTFNDVFHEIFTDVGGREIVLDLEEIDENGNFKTVTLDDNFFHIIIRPRPFDGALFIQDYGEMRKKRKLFRDLPAKKLDSSLIKETNLSRNSREIFNFFSVYPMTQNQTGYQFMAGVFVINGPSIQKYGYRPLQVPLHYSSPTWNSEKMRKTCLALSTDLARWYEYNDKYFSGDILLIGNPDVRIGDKIEFIWNERNYKSYWFYVEGVEIAYNITSNMSTTRLRVTRGVRAYPDKDFPDFYEYLREKNDEIGVRY